ncbi:UNVERIFIED_CONTAM: hypothetical protein K2H54_015730 [Gekko kuhli]
MISTRPGHRSIQVWDRGPIFFKKYMHAEYGSPTCRATTKNTANQSWHFAVSWVTSHNGQAVHQRLEKTRFVRPQNTGVVKVSRGATYTWGILQSRQAFCKSRRRKGPTSGTESVTCHWQSLVFSEEVILALLADIHCYYPCSGHFQKHLLMRRSYILFLNSLGLFLQVKEGWSCFPKIILKIKYGFD